MKPLLPREKLLSDGASALSDAELFAILLRSGPASKIKTEELQVMTVAKELLLEIRNCRGLMSGNRKKFEKIRGLGVAKTSMLLAIQEILKRALRPEIGLGTTFCNSPKEAFLIFQSLAFEKQEILRAAFLNNQNKLLAMKDLFKGTLDTTYVSPREILKEALEQNAKKILVAHNHPSGEVDPSPQDVKFTSELKTACACLGVSFMDHLIIAENNYFYSFANQSKMTWLRGEALFI